MTDPREGLLFTALSNHPAWDKGQGAGSDFRSFGDYFGFGGFFSGRVTLASQYPSRTLPIIKMKFSVNENVLLPH